jgi:hypothetical protein
MFNPFAKEVEILTETEIEYNFLLPAIKEEDLSEKKKSIGYMNPILLQIKSEKEFLIQSYHKFIYDPNEISLIYQARKNINDLFKDIDERLIRLRRFNLIVNPIIYDFTLKSGANVYDKSSSVWINDNGLKNKNFSRNFGGKEENLVIVLEKILKRFGNKVMRAEMQQLKHADLIMICEDGRYYFDVKGTDKKSIIKMSTLVDMWKHYKSIYHIE